jgi:hypothetical protein
MKILLKRSNKMAIRGVDKWGSGAFGASRGSRPHLGVDLVVQPGEYVYAPFDMKIERVSYPYTNSPYMGVAFVHNRGGNSYDGRAWYFNPLPSVIGRNVSQGEVIGVAQDLTNKYPGITNHVHLQLQGSNLEGLDYIIYKNKIYLDPTTLV